MIYPTTLPTAKGGSFDLADPHSHKFDIEEVAHALSNICRFNGHCREFYSVAQHSVLCSTINNESPYEKLMHDCSEAFIGDVTSPLKQMLPEYQTIERDIELALSIYFGLPTGMTTGIFKNGNQIGHVQNLPPEVKEVDLSMLATEVNSLMDNSRGLQEVFGWIEQEGIKSYSMTIRPWGHYKAKHAFLARFYELCPERFLTAKRWKHVLHHRAVPVVFWWK